MAAAKMKPARTGVCAFVAVFLFLAAPVFAQAPDGRSLQGRLTPPATPLSATPAEKVSMKDYVIGASDMLSIVFWREKDLTSDVLVRPDGKITLPLLNDLVAAGLTPEQLRVKLTEESRKFFKEDPVITVVVKQVANNRAFIAGMVQHPGAFEINGSTNVLQLIAMAGGLADFADGKHIRVLRTESGVQRTFSFNYDDVLKQKNPAQNMTLKPGDTVIVP